MKDFLSQKSMFISLTAIYLLGIVGCSYLFGESHSKDSENSVGASNVMTESIADTVEPTATLSPTDEQTQNSEITYPPFPDDVIEEFDIFFVDEYKLQFVTINGRLTGWFSKPILESEFWLVLDSFEIPSTEENAIFVYDGCYVSGETDSEIVAIGNLDDEAFVLRFLPTEKIHFAWRLNRHTNEVEVVDTENIECSIESSFRLKP